MQETLQRDIAAIQAMGAVPTILETVATITGLGFVCIARVTQDTWHACAVLDKLNFGLKVGGELDVTTTLCEEVRDSGKAIIIDHVSQSATYCHHHTPRIYGFESYISIPIFRQDGSYFGTLCGLDPKPARLSTPAITSSMSLFAQLISLQMDADAQLADTRGLLADERDTAELREQLITVLGHDLRVPLESISMAVEVGKRKGPDSAMHALLDHIGGSAERISSLVDNVVDFTHGRMGGDIGLALRREDGLHLAFEQVIEVLRGLYPERRIEAQLQSIPPLLCDPDRMRQMLSNLLNNALVHGDPQRPVQVSMREENGVLQLTVTNAGPRIPDEVKRQLFKPFWRGAAKVSQEGLGLGLFIVAEIARAHGGSIEVLTSDSATSFIYKVRRMDFAALGG
jgi:signal transduction histidine kinase